MSKLIIVGLVLIAGLSLAVAQTRIIILIKHAAVGSTGKVLKVNGTDHVLLVNGTNKLCRAGGC